MSDATIQSIVLVIHVILGIAIIGLVLVQRGKGAQAGAAFGGGASSTVFGARGSASFLTRLTGILAALFFVTSLTYAALTSSAPGETKTETPTFNPNQDGFTPGAEDDDAAAISPAALVESDTNKDVQEVTPADGTNDASASSPEAESQGGAEITTEEPENVEEPAVDAEEPAAANGSDENASSAEDASIVPAAVDALAAGAAEVESAVSEAADVVVEEVESIQSVVETEVQAIESEMSAEGAENESQSADAESAEASTEPAAEGDSEADAPAAAE